MGIVTIVFWASIVLLAYVFAGYPLLLRLLAGLGFGRPVAAASIEPSVTLIVSAYNERQVIAAKLDNCLALDYPAGLLEIIVVSDSSSDGTDDVVRSYGAPVRLLRMEERGGKTVGLNAAIRSARGEIVVFSDANAMYQPEAIRRLVRNFSDPEVGAVTGESRYVLGERDASTESENTYWSYELDLKMLESRLGSVVGGDGAIYAIRRSLYREMEAGDLSDFVNPLQIVAQGYRNVYEPSAISWESGAEGFSAEFRRKVRIVNRAWRATGKMRGLLNPFRFGFFSLQFFSHKVLRWLVPWLMLVAFAANLALAGKSGLYDFLLAGQLAFYTCALAGWGLADRAGLVGRALRIPYYFCLVNLASLVALVEVFGGKEYRTWASSRPAGTS